MGVQKVVHVKIAVCMVEANVVYVFLWFVWWRETWCVWNHKKHMGEARVVYMEPQETHKPQMPPPRVFCGAHKPRLPPSCVFCGLCKPQKTHEPLLPPAYVFCGLCEPPQTHKPQKCSPCVFLVHANHKRVHHVFFVVHMNHITLPHVFFGSMWITKIIWWIRLWFMWFLWFT